MGTRICYVVNSVSTTSVPATIATALTDYEDLDIDIFAWFEVEPFDGDDSVGVSCLHAPDTTTGINRATYRQARDQLKQYDLIQAHHTHSGTFANVIGYRLGIPLVSRVGNLRQGFTRKGRLAYGMTYGLTDRVVPNSQAVYDSFTWWERALVEDDHVRIIPNGVDLERIDEAIASDYQLTDEVDIPEESVVVGTVSVITEQKALDVLVKAIAQANGQAEKRLDLVIVGDGPGRSVLERLVHQLEIEEYVHFTGMVDRETVYKILGAIDIYSMPSRWEGFSNAAVEALGAGNPCVFSDIDPFLIPYRNVALFHKLDDGNDLAKRLVELSEDPDLREHYREKGRALVEEQYRLEQVAARYAELYAELV